VQKTAENFLEKRKFWLIPKKNYCANDCREFAEKISG
jgi:hypothetical protein